MKHNVITCSTPIWYVALVDTTAYCKSVRYRGLENDELLHEGVLMLEEVELTFSVTRF
jgi:hypothetical protein